MGDTFVEGNDVDMMLKSPKGWWYISINDGCIDIRENSQEKQVRE